MSEWLQRMGIANLAALRGAQTDHEELKAESAGPLAGLLGALPAEPDVAQSSKPPAYSSRLRVSETQQSNAQIITEIIQAEGSEKQFQTQKNVQSLGASQNSCRIHFVFSCDDIDYHRLSFIRSTGNLCRGFYCQPDRIGIA